MSDQVKDLAVKDARRMLLVSMLNDPNQGVRKCAAMGLEKLEALEAFDGLLERVRSGTPSERVDAVYALAKVPDDRALRALTGLLKHADEDVRAAAARALEEIIDPRTTKYLVEALEDESYTVREIAVETLAKLKDRKVTPFLITQLGALREDYLEKVITALGELGDARAEPPLTKFTRHKNPKLRGFAAIALGSLALGEEGV